MDINQIRNLKGAIERLSKWESTGNAFGFIENEEDAKPDYIYEFYCAMRILNDLAVNQNIKICPNNNGEYVFPKKPGKKSNYAKFLVKVKNRNEGLCQVCLGTEITISNSPNTTFAADISFQKGNADNNPNEEDILLIMDAKYKANKNNTLSISAIREFAQCVRDMQVPKYQEKEFSFDQFQNIKGNCILTNGKTNTIHNKYCINRKLKQVGDFDCDGRSMQVVG